MKIEKLNENKIRITLDLNDLAEKDIDFHSFMSNPIESQNLFLDMLKNYLIHQMSNWNKKFMYIIKKMKHGTLKKIQCLNLIQIIFHI